MHCKLLYLCEHEMCYGSNFRFILKNSPGILGRKVFKHAVFPQYNIIYAFYRVYVLTLHLTEFFKTALLVNFYLHDFVPSI